MTAKKQKRELPEDFDPVYPYDAPQLQLNPPFISGDGFNQSVDGVLSLHIAPPLVFDNTRALTLAFDKGLQLFGNQLIVATEGSGLTINEDGKLVLQVSSPLTLTANGISLSLGPGLSSSDDRLSLQVTSPLTLTAGGISLPLGPGLFSSDNGLSLQVTSPLQLQGNALTLSLGTGLQDTDGSVAVKLGAGLTTDGDQGVTVQVGSGLKLNGKLLTVPAEAPLVSGNTGLSFNYSPDDFRLDNGSLSLLPKPISVTPPLRSSADTISLIYSATDFSLENNTTLALAPKFKPYTLWTGNSSTENVTLKDATTRNGTFFLCLTRVGGLVLGTFALKTSTITFNDMRQNVKLVFNSVGSLLTDQSTFKGEFGFRSDNSVITPANAGLSPAWLMPSTFIYPNSSGSTLTTVVKIVQTYVNVDIKVNTVSTGYSLEFQFQNMSFSTTFATSYGTFCYVPQST